MFYFIFYCISVYIDNMVIIHIVLHHITTDEFYTNILELYSTVKSSNAEQQQQQKFYAKLVNLSDTLYRLTINFPKFWQSPGLNL